MNGLSVFRAPEQEAASLAVVSLTKQPTKPTGEPFLSTNGRARESLSKRPALADEGTYWSLSGPAVGQHLFCYRYHPTRKIEGELK